MDRDFFFCYRDAFILNIYQFEKYSFSRCRRTKNFVVSADINGESRRYPGPFAPGYDTKK